MRSFLISILIFASLTVSAQSDPDFDFELIPYRKGKLYGYTARNTKNLVISPQFEEANLFAINERALVKLKGKYGYIDKRGKFIVEPLYEEAMDYVHGCAFVKDKNNVYTLLDSEGKSLITEVERISYTGFSEGFQSVKKGGNWGLIDTLGKVVLPFSYWMINPVKYEMCVARKDIATFGLLSVKGDTLVPFEFPFIAAFNKESIASFEHKDGRKGFITCQGKLVYENESFGTKGGFWEGYAHLKKGGKYGFIDSLGNIVIPVQYEGVKRFDEGLCAVKKGKWGVIDLEGNVVVPFEYNMIFGCSDGMCEVYAKGDAGYVNVLGELVISPAFANAHKFNGGMAAVEKEGKVALINKQGKMITDFIYDVKEYDIYIPKDGVIWLWKNGFYGLVNDKGVELTEFIYNRKYPPVLGLIMAGRFVKGKDWKYGVLDINGKEVTPFIFSQVTIYDEEHLIQGKVGKGMDVKEGIVYMEANGLRYFED